LWYDAIAKYKEMQLPKEDLSEMIQHSVEELEGAEAKEYQLKDLLSQIRPLIPGIVQRIQDKVPLLRF
jgi:hypothetical protein